VEFQAVSLFPGSASMPVDGIGGGGGGGGTSRRQPLKNRINSNTMPKAKCWSCLLFIAPSV